VDAGTVKRIARQCGFELAGIAPALPAEDVARFDRWLSQGMAGEMRYMTDRRAELRRDPRNLLESARSVICVGKLYNTSPETPGTPISRYAWGEDYHDVLRAGLSQVVEQLAAIEPFEWKICVDTAPLLERSYARLAGLGWIGKNTCLIHEPLGSWFFLGEILTSLELEPDSPAPDRCGTCTRCIDACPTQALIPDSGGVTLDSRRCISYLTIELRGPLPEEPSIGEHVFGCDVCQDVCPWNSRAPVTIDPAFARRDVRVEDIAAMSEAEFREFARGTPLARPKHEGLKRNLAASLVRR
jgi:epoxyqueuosine reductase